MRTPESLFDSRDTRAIAREALALLQQQEMEADETGQRARWIAALEAMTAGSPQVVSQDAETMAEVTNYLELLGQSSISPFADEDDPIGEYMMGRPDPADGDAVLRHGRHRERGSADDQDASPEAGEEPSAPLSSPAFFASTASVPDPAAAQLRVSEQDEPAEGEDDIARLEQALERVEAMRAQGSDAVATGTDIARDAQLPRLLELKKNIQQADMDVRAAQEEVSARELNVLSAGYARDAMHAATRQIDVDLQQIQLDEKRLEVTEKDSARRHDLELRRLDVELRRLEMQRVQHDRDMAFRERTAEVDETRAEGEREVQLAASARAHTTMQLTASACTITLTSWLVLPGAGVGISLLSLSPLLAVLLVLFLLTTMALSRTRAVKPTENTGRSLSWTDGVRAVPLLPVAALLITTSAVLAFISVFAPRDQRNQLNGYAHRSLQTAERVLLGR